MIPSTKTVRELNILASKQITNSVIATLLLRDSGTDVFLWILRNFYEHLFIEHLRVTASGLRPELIAFVF